MFHWFHNHKRLFQLTQEVQRMSAITDRLTAAVNANSDKVDALIAKVGAGDPGAAAALAEAEAAIVANADKTDATNAKIDAVLNPVPAV